MKKLLLTALLLMISGRVFAATFYEQYGCEYICKPTYRETVTDTLGFKRDYLVLPCKYNFCYFENGSRVYFTGMRDKMTDCNKDSYCFHFRFVTN